MKRPNDSRRSLIPLEQESTLIAVIELSQSSWLVAGIVPGDPSGRTTTASHRSVKSSWQANASSSDPSGRRRRIHVKLAASGLV